MNIRPLYPFTAIVGQEQMKLALLLNAVHPALGGVLVRGEKGTAKSTAVRALASLLPEIEAVRGCAYGCDPADSEPCDDCSARGATAKALPVARRRVPMVELPIGAGEDRVLGSLDIEQAIAEGARRFEPGLLARANRGILYVDEVNLLADHLVDVLLDAAAMGRNYVEREGISVSHPARFMLVGTMNPEEGELRPQLLDRFALTVDVTGFRDPAGRAEVVRRRIAFEADPAGFIAAWAAAEQAERERLAHARALVPSVHVPDAMLHLIARVCAAFEVDGLRADLAMHRAAAAHAALAGRTIVDAADVRVAAELALPHRRRRKPFEQPGLDREQLDAAMGDAGEQHGADDGGFAGSPAHPPPPTPPGGNGAGQSSSEPVHPRAAGSLPAGPSDGRATGRQAPARAEAGPAEPADSYPVIPLRGERRRPAAPQRPGRRSAGAEEAQGPVVRTALPRGRPRELALAATVRAAAPHQPIRRQARRGRRSGPPVLDPNPNPARIPDRCAWTAVPDCPGVEAEWSDDPPPARVARHAARAHVPALLLRPSDLRERVRRGRARNLVLLVVDASGSMGAHNRMAAAKGAVLSLLLDAYRRRDRVALVAFRGAGAELLLPPTNSVDLAERRLRAVPTGGRTPLAAGLALSLDVAERAARERDAAPLVVLISDMRPNAATGGADPWRAALAVAERLRAAEISTVVIDTEPARNALGLGRPLAAAMGARYLRLEHLRAGHIEQAIDPAGHPAGRGPR